MSMPGNHTAWHESPHGVRVEATGRGTKEHTHIPDEHCALALPIGHKHAKKTTMQCHPSGDCLHATREVCCHPDSPEGEECGPQEMDWWWSVVLWNVLEAAI